MGTMQQLGGDVRRGFHVGGNDLETAGNREGITAECVRETVITGMARGETLPNIAQRMAMVMHRVHGGKYHETLRRARQLVRLAYLGS